MHTSPNTPNTVLVADDDVIITDLVEKVLAGAGFRVVCANSGEQAVDIAASGSISIALLDYRMGELNGIETGQAIFKMTGRRYILMSVQSDRETVEKAAIDGALGFLSKPLSLKDLAGHITVGLQRTVEFDHLNDRVRNMKTISDNAVVKGITSARLVNTAIGIIMERTRSTRDEANKQIITMARSQRRKLVDLCGEIISAREQYYSMASSITKERDQE